MGTRFASPRPHGATAQAAMGSANGADRPARDGAAQCEESRVSLPIYFTHESRRWKAQQWFSSDGVRFWKFSPKFQDQPMPNYREYRRAVEYFEYGTRPPDERLPVVRETAADGTS